MLANPPRITIVDNVITEGRTLLATAALLRARFPNAEIRVFALIRTMGLQPDVERIVTLCAEVIEHFWNDTQRMDDVPAK